jgi:CSLREA domain-containing protein
MKAFSIFALLGLLAAPASAASVVFTVDASTDAVDDSIGDGVCHTAAGPCTLRAAIQEANVALPANDVTIVFSVASVTLSIPGVNENASAVGDLDILRPMSVCAAAACAAASNVVVDGGQLDTVFHVLNAGAVTMKNLEITNGKITPGYSDGGGVLVEGASTVTIDSCHIHHNSAYNYGGGVYNLGTATIINSTIDTNSAADGAGVFSGGATTVVQSLLTANAANYGAIYSTGALTLINATVSTNAATTYSGVFIAGGTAEIASSTIANNTGPSVSGLFVQAGTARLRGCAAARSRATRPATASATSPRSARTSSRRHTRAAW